MYFLFQFALPSLIFVALYILYLLLNLGLEYTINSKHFVSIFSSPIKGKPSSQCVMWIFKNILFLFVLVINYIAHFMNGIAINIVTEGEQIRNFANGWTRRLNFKLA